MAQDWDIRPRSESCHGCGQPFEDRQACFSTLMVGEAGYQRADYCAACRERTSRDRPPYSAWQGVFRKPPPAPEEPLKKETAESLLRRLMETDDPARINVIFILTVMLERKRILAERDARIREDGEMVRVYEHRRTGETFLIRDPRLRLDQVDAVQQEVAAMLDGASQPAAADGAQPPAGAEPPAASAEAAP